MTAVDRLLKSDPRFVVDEAIDSKIAVTASPRGYLRKQKG
jgi:cephalosporin hydroxylase